MRKWFFVTTSLWWFQESSRISEIFDFAIFRPECLRKQSLSFSRKKFQQYKKMSIFRRKVIFYTTSLWWIVKSSQISEILRFADLLAKKVPKITIIILNEKENRKLEKLSVFLWESDFLQQLLYEYLKNLVRFLKFWV